jgi:predicted metalloprotease
MPEDSADRSRPAGPARTASARRTAVLAVAVVLIVGVAGGPAQYHPKPSVASINQQAPVTSAPTPSSEPTPRSTQPTSPATTDWRVDDETPLLQNAVYEAGKVPAVSCRLPSALLASKAALVKYTSAMTACLDRSWGQALARSGFYFEPPVLTAYEEKTSSPCGPSDVDDSPAFYCSTNKTIYFDWTQYVSAERIEQPWVQASTMFMLAHEYGHHVQELVGIGMFFDDRYDRATGDAQLQESRRLELQASCFASAFLGANKRALNLRGERLAGLEDEEYLGDEPGYPRDHGSADSNQNWTSGAYKSANPGSCNTWTASAQRVS